MALAMNATTARVALLQHELSIALCVALSVIINMKVIMMALTVDATAAAAAPR
jgi:hypothetical protein